MLAIDDKLPSIWEDRDTINQSILDDGESYKVHKSDYKSYILQCNEMSCALYIRAVFEKKNSVSITKISPHCCRPTVH